MRHVATQQLPLAGHLPVTPVLPHLQCWHTLSTLILSLLGKKDHSRHLHHIDNQAEQESFLSYIIPPYIIPPYIIRGSIVKKSV